MFKFLHKRDKEVKTEIKVKEIDELDLVFDHLYNELGINNLYKRPILHDRLRYIAKKYKINTVQDFITKVKRDKTLYEEVIDAVTVNETYFFREVDNLQWLVEQISKENKDIKILSIPSSNGAEIYSLLIMLDMKNPLLLDKIKFIGIDINNVSIKKAQKGIFNERELHKLNDNLKSKYFNKSQKEYEIKDFLKNSVEFFNDNIFSLSTDKYGGFDIVLSRNLFIYFDTIHRIKASKILHRLLKPGGYLIIGVTDRMDKSSNFKQVANFIYQKV